MLPRYNGYSAIEIVGNSAPGYSTGQAIDTLQNIVDHQLPAGFAADWTGQSFQELLSGSSAITLLLLSIVVVFLCLAALYESWSIPAAVLLVVPLGMLGMLAFCLSFGVPNDIYFKIGLVTVIGLAAKNAILIVEFAVEGQQQRHDAARRRPERGPAEIAADPDDVDGVHPRRVPARYFIGCRRCFTSRNWHRCDRRDAVRDILRSAADSGVLCGRKAIAGRQARRGVAQDASSR